MIIDYLLLLDTANTITTTTASDNMIDLANARDMGVGNRQNVKVLCQIATAFQTTDSATLTVRYKTSTDGSAWVTAAQSAAYTASNLTAGARLFQIDIPNNPVTHRYITADYIVGAGTASWTVGAVTLALVLDRDDYRQYPSGFSVAN